MNHDLDKEKLAEYALDALDEIERRKLTARINSDPELAAEAENWREAAAALSYFVETAEPAPEVRARILERIKNAPQASGGGLSEEKSFAPPKIAAIESNVVQFAPRPARNVWSYASGIGAVAASIIAVFLAFSLYSQLQSNHVKNEQLAELNQKLSASEQKLIDAQTQIERQRQEREMLGSPSTIVASLNGTETSPTAKARLVFDKKTGKALLFVENLPDAPKGKAYQVWFISDPAKPTPGQTFETGTSGKAELRDQMPASSLNSTVFAVTLEPVGGSPAPTGEKYLLGHSL